MVAAGQDNRDLRHPMQMWYVGGTVCAAAIITETVTLAIGQLSQTVGHSLVSQALTQ